MSDVLPTMQLEMIWPREKLGDVPEIPPPAGYALRTFRPGDDDEFIGLMQSAGFDGWNREMLHAALQKALPDGIFLAVHTETDAMVATAMATHNPAERHPYGGELGWVAAHPDHRGRGLGLVVCAAVMKRYAAAGYRRIYLKTDDWRLPAIKTYLRLGFVPFLFAPDMEERWREVCRKLGWNVEIDRWPHC